MDPWRLFSELCRRVVEEQNVVLEVAIIGDRILMSLAPIADYEDFDNWEDKDET